jgi:hypothetical protein
MILFFENTWLLWWAIAFVAVIRFSHFFIDGVRSRNQPLPTKCDAINSKSQLFLRSEGAKHLLQATKNRFGSFIATIRPVSIPKVRAEGSPGESAQASRGQVQRRETFGL